MTSKAYETNLFACSMVRETHFGKQVFRLNFANLSIVDAAYCSDVLTYFTHLLSGAGMIQVFPELVCNGMWHLMGN